LHPFRSLDDFFAPGHRQTRSIRYKKRSKRAADSVASHGTDWFC